MPLFHKGRYWAYLRAVKVYMHLISEIPIVIVACCVLHNYILQNEEDDIVISTDYVFTQMSDAAVVGNAAITKRMEIANMLA